MKRHLTDSQNIQAYLDTFKASLYFSMPGSVIAYHPGTRTADVQPMTNDVRKDLATGAPLYEQWPPLVGLPVMWPRFNGGSAGSFIVAGKLVPNDQVLLEAFDLDPSTWMAQGRSKKPMNPAHIARFGGHWRVNPSDIASPPAGVSTSQPEPGTHSVFLIGPDGSEQQLRFNTDGTISIGGDHTDDFVALATLVKGELDKIAKAFRTFSPGSGGASFPNAYTSASSVAATIAKAK